MAPVNSGPSPTGLESIPPELAVKVWGSLNPSDVLPLFLASKYMGEVFNKNKPMVMSLILKSQPGIDNILYVYTAQYDENNSWIRMLHLRTVNFKYDGPTSPSQINLMGENLQANQHLSTDVFSLGWAQFMEIWDMVKVMDRWVELFPRILWREDPENRRCLTPNEEARLRRALSGWWLYAHHNHGLFHDWRSFMEPQKWDRDPRLKHIRRMSTDEILELEDLWGVVRDAVSNDLCSSPERICHCDDGYVVDLVPWGLEDGRHETIVSTYMKLSPDHLLYYLTEYYNCKRNVTVETITAGTRVLFRWDMFNWDIETLSISIQKVLEERMLLRGSDYVTFPVCTVVDDNRASQDDISIWSNDNSPDGRSPVDSDQILALNLPVDQRVVVLQGDDGSDDALPR